MPIVPEQHQPVLLDHADGCVAREIYGIFQRAYTVEAALIGVRDFPPLQRSVDEIRSSDNVFHGLEIGTYFVAVIETVVDSDGLEIVSMAVDPKHFRQGCGTALLEHILASEDVSSVTVETAEANSPAIGFYCKHGFSQVTTWLSPDGVRLVKLRTKRRHNIFE